MDRGLDRLRWFFGFPPDFEGFPRSLDGWFGLLLRDDRGNSYRQQLEDRLACLTYQKIITVEAT